MTISELFILVNCEMIAGNQHREVKVWLPGSSISLNNNGDTMIRKGDVLMIEGNVDDGAWVVR